MIDLLIHPEWLAAAANGTLQAFNRPVAGDGPLITADGVAIVRLMGPMSKGGSEGFFGPTGASTIEARNRLYEAVQNEAVKAILLHIDSPGGTVAGTAELGDDIAQFNQVKPIHAHIDDLGASAALWAASAAGSISANRMAQIGSIGVVAVVADQSARAEMEGIKFHVVSTGRFKGAGTPGTPITEEHLGHIQERVDQVNAHFMGAIAEGRGIDPQAVRAMADGRTHIAADAQAMGLIDEIMDFRSAVAFAGTLGNGTVRRDAVAARIRGHRVK